MEDDTEESIRLSTGQTRTFVDLWESYACLWNPEHPQYNSSAARTAACTDIGKTFGWTADKVNRKLDSLRTYWRTLRRRREKARASNASLPTPQWPLFDRIDGFLGPLASKSKQKDGGNTVANTKKPSCFEDVTGPSQVMAQSLISQVPQSTEVSLTEPESLRKLSLSDAEMEDFIQHWRKHTCLWQSWHPLHSSRPARVRAYKDIAQIFEWTVDEVSRKMDSLRTYWRSAKRKREMGLTVKWTHFDSIDSFLGQVPEQTSESTTPTDDITSPPENSSPVILISDADGQLSDEETFCDSDSMGIYSRLKLSKDQTEYFIQQWRKHFCLWVQSHPHYNNRPARARAYEDIAQMFGWTADQVCRKIDSLRTYWQTEKRRRAKGKIVKWPYFDIIDSFLGQAQEQIIDNTMLTDENTEPANSSTANISLNMEVQSDEDRGCDPDSVSSFSHLKLSKDQTKRFIQQWRKHCCLWVQSHPHYNSRPARARAYEDIAQMFGWTADQVSRKIDSLRTYWRTEKRRREKGKIVKWPYFNLIDSFLEHIPDLSDSTMLTDEDTEPSRGKMVRWPHFDRIHNFLGQVLEHPRLADEPTGTIGHNTVTVVPNVNTRLMASETCVQSAGIIRLDGTANKDTWDRIAADHSLKSPSDVVNFLLGYYKDTQEKHTSSTVCQSCNAPLILSCIKCCAVQRHCTSQLANIKTEPENSSPLNLKCSTGNKTNDAQNGNEQQHHVSEDEHYGLSSEQLDQTSSGRAVGPTDLVCAGMDGGTVSRVDAEMIVRSGPAQDYTTVTNLSRHRLSEENDLAAEHCQDSAIKCAKCGKAFALGFDLNKHDCASTCSSQAAGEDRFTVKTDPKQNTESSKLTQKSFYICQHCNKTFPDPKGLMQHISAFHPIKNSKRKPVPAATRKKISIKSKNLLYPCTVCGKKYRSSYIAEHKKVHTGEKPFSCHYCGKTFAFSTALKNHLLIHTGIKPFECVECGRKFTTRQSLKYHTKALHSWNKCKYCEATFTDRDSSIKHMQCHIGEESFTSELKTCIICKATLSGKQALKRHMRKHAAVESGIRAYTCSVCKKSFHDRSGLRKHWKTHLKERPFKCHCGKSFQRNSSLTTHLKTHMGVKPYQCHVCGKAFGYMSTLEQHLQSHTKSDQ